MTKVSVTQEQMHRAQQAFDISAMNGIVSLAAMLSQQGLLSDEQVKLLYEMVSKPLVQPDVSDNPAVQYMHGILDNQFSALLNMK